MVTAVHDISDGGLLVALAEMAMASGIGAKLEAPHEQPSHAFWFGGNIGALAASSPTFAFVPFAGGAYVRSRITARGPDGSESATDGYFGISVGAGLVFMRLTIRPSISFPIGLEGGSRTNGLEFAFNIGRKTAVGSP